MESFLEVAAVLGLIRWVERVVEVNWIKVFGVVSSAELPMATDQSVNVAIIDVLDKLVLEPKSFSFSSIFVFDDPKPVFLSIVVVIHLGCDTCFGIIVNAILLRL